MKSNDFVGFIFPWPKVFNFERRLVEPTGFEPATPTMPLWCSTN
jgi:hypothetical protein